MRLKYQLHVSNSSYHGFFQTPSNHIFGFGENKNGELGIGRKTNLSCQAIRTFKNFERKILKISVSHEHTMLLLSDHSVWACGKLPLVIDDDIGSKKKNIDDYEFKEVYKPIKLVDKVEDISGGFFHNFFIFRDNIKSYGSNYFGQCALRKGTIVVNTLTRINFERRTLKKIQCCGYYTIFLRKNGELLYCGSIHKEHNKVYVPKMIDKTLFVSKLYDLGRKIIFFQSKNKLYSLGNVEGYKVPIKNIKKYKKSKKQSPYEIDTSIIDVKNLKDIKCFSECVFFLLSDGKLLCYGNSNELENVITLNVKYQINQKFKVIQIEGGYNSIYLFLKNGNIFVGGRNLQGQLLEGKCKYNNLNHSTLRKLKKYKSSDFALKREVDLMSINRSLFEIRNIYYTDVFIICK